LVAIVVNRWEPESNHKVVLVVRPKLSPARQTLRYKQRFEVHNKHCAMLMPLSKREISPLMGVHKSD
jgi:hypothetical protein